MRKRSRAREVALQLLVQHDLNPGVDRAALASFVRERMRDTAVEPFCLSLYDGTVANLAEIDRRLSEAAHNWRLPRMAVVDRNVLRLGAYELLFTPETPRSVALNEAIEMARRFGSAGSPAFVNGVLDRVTRAQAAESAAPPPAPSATEGE